MCGRFTLTSPEEALATLFGYDGPTLDLAPRYNIAPGQEVTAVRLRPDGRRGLLSLRWGLIPSWTADEGGGRKPINARAETVAEKPSFRDAFRTRRCLIPADGFFEWAAVDAAGTKRPWWIHRKDRTPFAFAGLWDVWQGPAGTVRSCAIVTTMAAAAIAHIHPRMPVIVAPDDHAAWLDTEGTPPDAALALLRTGDTGPAAELVATPVSTRVNNIENDDATLLHAA